jgi:hypothetical protein
MAEFVPVSISSDVTNTENEIKLFLELEAVSLSKLHIKNLVPHKQQNPCPLCCWSWSDRPAGRPDHDQQHCYDQAPTVNQRQPLQLLSS